MDQFKSPMNAVPSLEKNHPQKNISPSQEEVINPANDNQTVTSSAVESALTTISFSRAELEKLCAENADPAEILGLFDRDFSETFDQDVNVHEKYNLRQHTQLVLQQFDRYFGHMPLPGKTSKVLMKTILALHDFGKPEAVKRKNKHLQHEITAARMGPVMMQLNFSDEEIALAKALISRDPIGTFFKKIPSYSIVNAVSDIKQMAAETSMHLADFFELLVIFYASDSSSYTSDAGGVRNLDYLFDIDPSNKILEFSDDKKEMLALLRERLLGISNRQYNRKEIFSEYSSKKAQIKEDLEKFDSMAIDEKIAFFNDLFANEEEYAVSFAYYLYNVDIKKSIGTDKESTKANIENCAKDETVLMTIVELFKQVKSVRNKDQQFGLMQVLYHHNPALYVAAMERLTYGVNLETSKKHADAKIDNVLHKHTPAAMDQIVRLSVRVEKEILPRMLDTHGTSVSSLLSIFERGEMINRKDLNVSNLEIRGDDLKLAGSLSVFTYLGTFFEHEDIFITVDPDYIEAMTAEKNSSFYLSEDYPIYPIATPEGSHMAGKRMSISEKLDDVMLRHDVKRYLAVKIAEHIYREARKNGVDYTAVQNIDLEASMLQYLRVHNLAAAASDDKLGGRPEGHMKFPIPINKLRLLIPGYDMKEFLEYARSYLKSATEKNDRSVIKSFNDLRKKMCHFLKLSPGLSIEELIEVCKTDEYKRYTFRDFIIDYAKELATSSGNSALQDFVDHAEERISTFPADTRQRHVKAYFEATTGITLHETNEFNKNQLVLVETDNEVTLHFPDEKFFAYLKELLLSKKLIHEQQIILSANKMSIAKPYDYRQLKSVCINFVDKYLEIDKISMKEQKYLIHDELIRLKDVLSDKFTQVAGIYKAMIRNKKNEKALEQIKKQLQVILSDEKRDLLWKVFIQNHLAN